MQRRYNISLLDWTMTGGHSEFDFESAVTFANLHSKETKCESGFWYFILLFFTARSGFSAGFVD